MPRRDYVGLSIHLGVLVEVNWPFKGDKEDPDWVFCMEESNFIHKNACEFILHIGENPATEFSYANGMLKRMKEKNCSKEFITAYESVVKMGAIRVLFWA